MKFFFKKEREREMKLQEKQESILCNQLGLLQNILTYTNTLSRFHLESNL